MAFKTFETEEEYTEAINSALEEKNKSWIADRLETARNNAIKETEEKYKDYSELKKQLEASTASHKDYDKQIAELTASRDDLKTKLATSAADALKLKAAAKYGIPFEMADRIKGTSEEEIEDDAKKTSQFYGKSQPQSAPLRNPEAEAVDGVTAAFRKLNPNIKL